MGWGSVIAGAAQIAGGAIIGGMSFGAAAPIAASLIGSGISTIGGGIAADASKKAAQEQQASAKEAQQVNQQLYDSARQTQHDAYARGQSGLAPYQGLGTAATTNLGTLMGFGALPMPAAIPPLAPTGQMSSTATGQVAQGAVPRAEAMPIEAAGVAGSVRAPVQSPQQQAQIQTASAYGSSAGPRLVTLKAPTGETIQLPSNDPAIAQFLARGAQQVA